VVEIAPAPIIVPLFATPFVVVSLGAAAQLNPSLAVLFTSRATEERRDPAAPADRLCYRSREDLFDWQDEAVGLLRREMLGGICTAVMAVNCYTDAEFDALGVQARARFTVVRPNGCVPAATAPMASWYALYCVAAPAPVPTRADSGTLRLYAVRDASMFMDAANWRLRAPFDRSHFIWKPVPGEMAVFPASILHEVALNRTETDLLVVAARVRFAHGGQTAMPPW
jgi:hypothetical protein